MICPNCGSRLGISKLARLFGGIRCDQCGQKSRRNLTSTRVVGCFLALWAVIAAIYFWRDRLDDNGFLLLLMSIYCVVSFAMVATAPLIAEAAASRWQYLQGLILPAILSLLTMLGLRLLQFS
jgi:hypothetical protein